ncbi:MAG: hypothetical protein L0Y50_11670 [Beijerinckiaceae bacterium]|nr:hypothetical protein [Beijerinckiaceae bacterium]MCI0736908.1 hypothetical protein [Beijerinckiaceae bacterium]
MNQTDRLLGTLLWLLAVLAVAGITHIIAIFALPDAVGKDTYARISELAKTGQLTVFPRGSPEKQLIPFSDPAMVQAVCPFDLSQGGLRLHADVEGDRLLALAFRTPAGKLFYSMTDLAAQQGKIDVVVLTAEQLESVETDDDEENPSQDLRLLAPGPRGFVIASALAAYPGERADAEERIKSVSCAVEQIALD